MTHKVYVVTDLGPGDGGKGGVVHAICNMMRPHIVIKRGGAQGSHGVRTARGEKFNFSQWGCGTLEGIPTFLSAQMIISPEALVKEAARLRYDFGVHNVFSLLTVDERALCANSFHGIASHLLELARRGNPRGTVGSGVGAAYRMYQRSPELAITARDLQRPGLRDRLAAIRDQVRLDLLQVIDGDFLREDRAAAEEEIELLYDDGFLNHVADRFAEVAKQVTIVGSDYLGDAILTREGVAVVETSHGVLTDRLMGFHPHTSAIRTLPSFTHGMLRDAGYNRQIVNIGVTRAYAVRHGAGPMPTADPDMADRLLPGSAKDENRYQGKIRVGPLDSVLLRYAIAACEGTTFDGLAVTWFDQIRTDGVWEVCHAYNGADDPAFFSPTGDIQVDHGTTTEHIEHQCALGQALLACSPQITATPVNAEAGNDALYDVCASVMQQAVGVPVRMVSLGPTERDKLFR